MNPVDCKVLVIEDNPVVTQAIRSILEERGYEPVCRSDGSSGLEAAGQEDPDVILCDINLPDMDGFRILRSVQQDPRLQHIPFIFLTSRGGAEDLREGMMSGADDYLSKPFHPDELIASIQARIRRNQVIERRYRENFAMQEQRLIFSASFDETTELPLEPLLKAEYETFARDENGYLVIARFPGLERIAPMVAADDVRCIIRAISERLMTGTGSAVFRIGRDELAFFVLNADEAGASVHAEQCLRLFHSCLECNERLLHLPGLFGMSQLKHDVPFESALRNARVAAKYAEASGGTGFRIFDESMETRLGDQLFLESELRQALARNEFHLVFQPRVLLPGRVVGAEALVRWTHPRLGNVPPSVFIPVAEESGTIDQIGNWVLSESAKKLSEWKMQGLPEDFTLAVNVSGRQLESADFLPLLQSLGGHTNSLELEITETFLIKDIHRSVALFKQVRELGLQLAVDDFGCGYSSLRYLK
ncbi:MAG TPA: EAL domain-containing protein, partial [Leptospiraceae bacterium]|nr:EAL domain-containing protein [Leptospiraceae bacterium]